MNKIKKSCLYCKKEIYVTYSKIKTKKYCSRACLEKDKQINKQCKTCEKIFTVPKSWDGVKYCSSVCREIDIGKKRKKCKMCEKIFYVNNCCKDAKYCSPQCWGKAKSLITRIEKKCLFCNKIFYNKDNKTYCSHQCFYLDNKKENNGRWIKNRPKCIDCKIELKPKGKKTSIRCGKCYFKGTTTDNMKIRNSEEYKKLREYIFIRDNYCCALCNSCGIELNMHHIRKFSKYKEGRLDPKNLITVCRKCHFKYVNHNEEDCQDYFDILILDREILNKTEWINSNE